MLEPIQTQTTLQGSGFWQMINEAKILPSRELKPFDFICVKKKVGKKEWNNSYSQMSSYCFLGQEDKDGVWIGFIVANPEINGKLLYPIGTCPDECFLMNNDEILKINTYRQSYNQRPFPLE